MANGIQLIAESLAGAKELMDQLSSRCEVEKPEIVDLAEHSVLTTTCREIEQLLSVVLAPTPE